MSKRIPAALLVLLLCLGLLAGCGQRSEENQADGPSAGGRSEDADQAQTSSSPDDTQGGPADATIMIYMVGSNLESKGGAATSDLVEMVNSGVNFDRKNVIVMTGGAKTWRGGTGISADEIGIYQLNKRGVNKLSSSPSASMCVSETLSTFLNYATENFPAQSYGLIFWDHGNGPMLGFGEDELFHDKLTLAELHEGMANSPFGADNKLAFVGFDACLMSSAEVGWSLQEYADYMIASEEVIPGGGWDYHFLAQLPDGPLDGAQVGYVVTETYGANYLERLAGQALLDRLTLACLDLRHADAMEHALNDLFSAMELDLASGKYAQIAQLRQETLPFAKYTTGTDYDLIDLGDLAERMMSLYPDEAEALMQAVDNMVAYLWTPLDRAHGVSIYYPMDNTKYYEKEWGPLYPSFGFAPNYSRFMASFGQELLGGFSEAWMTTGMPELSQDEGSSEYYIQLTEELAADYLDGSYYLLRKLDEGHYTLCGERKDLVLDSQNRLCALFAGNSVYVINNVGEQFATLYYDYSETGSHDFHVAGTLFTDVLADDFRFQNVWFLVSLPQPGASEALNIGIERTGDLEEVKYGKEEVSIHDFPSVYFPLVETWEERDADGRMLPVTQWNSQISDMFAAYDTSTGWRAELRPLGDDGFEYYIQIVARDSHNREYGSELIPVQLTQQGQEMQGEMFQNRFYPLPDRTDPIPELPPLESLRYFTDTRWYAPAQVEETLVMDDPSGMRMTLLSGAYRLDNEGERKDLILIFRLDDDSRYFDIFDLSTDSEFRIPVGNRMTRVYFLPETFGVRIQRGGSYYYTMSIPLDELPEGQDSLSCVFFMRQREWTTQVSLTYETEPVSIPLPK